MEAKLIDNVRFFDWGDILCMAISTEKVLESDRLDFIETINDYRDAVNGEDTMSSLIYNIQNWVMFKEWAFSYTRLNKNSMFLIGYKVDNNTTYLEIGITDFFYSPNARKIVKGVGVHNDYFSAGIIYQMAMLSWDKVIMDR